MKKGSLIQRKKSQSNLKDLMKVNHQCNEFAEYVIQKYELEKEDAENMDKLQQHLINMNVVFAQMLDAMKNNK